MIIEPNGFSSGTDCKIFNESEDLNFKAFFRWSQIQSSCIGWTSMSYCLSVGSLIL